MQSSDVETVIIGHKRFPQLQVTPYLPYIVFSVAAWIGAALTHFTPETNNMKMPETLGEAEHLELEESIPNHHHTTSSLREEENEESKSTNDWFKA